MSQTTALSIHIDGAARGNPGPAACAYVIARDGHPVIEAAESLGETTSNVAEYTALTRALARAAELGGQRLIVHSDSELLVKQMNGLYRVKNEQLRELYQEAKRLSAPFNVVTIRHVPREENSRADRLCNEVLDGRKTATRPARATKAASREAVVREEVLVCLHAAARAWSKGDPTTPAAEQVWDQLWSILEENGVVR